MISYIMPYIDDRESLLKMTLQSLECQSIQDYEVILVCHEDTNPATAFNYGVSQANGDIICLTSPEVFNATHNIRQMHTLPSKTYWVGWCGEARLEDIPGCWNAECLKQAPQITSGIFAHCTEEDWQPWKYFLGVLHKEDYHPMDEYFTDGIAYEDRDWADRLRVKAEFNPKIVGLHLSHPRDYQHRNPTLRRRNREWYYGKQGIGEEVALKEMEEEKR